MRPLMALFVVSMIGCVNVERVVMAEDAGEQADSESTDAFEIESGDLPVEPMADAEDDNVDILSGADAASEEPDGKETPRPNEEV